MARGKWPKTAYSDNAKLFQAVDKCLKQVIMIIELNEFLIKGNIK